MSDTIIECDLRAMMAVVEDGRRDDPTEGLPWAVMDGLAALVRCDNVSFPEADLVHSHSLVDQWVEDGNRGLELDGGDHREPPEFWEYAKEFLPCSYPDRTGDLASVVRWSDFYTPTRLRNTPFYAEFFGPAGVKHALHASLPTAPGHMRKISFWRGTGPDFTERDRLVIQLLRPHIYEVYLDTQRRRHRIARLSPREWDVLQLAHQGHTNRDIARQLFISVATVRKHMEHIFDRTGIRNRAAVAALMIPHLAHVVPPNRTRQPRTDQ